MATSTDPVWSYLNAQDVWNMKPTELVELYDYWKDQWIMAMEPEKEARAEATKNAIESVMATRFAKEHSTEKKKEIAFSDR